MMLFLSVLNDANDGKLSRSLLSLRCEANRDLPELRRQLTLGEHKALRAIAYIMTVKVHVTAIQYQKHIVDSWSNEEFHCGH